MSSRLLPEFNLKPGDYGWTGQFPEGPHRLFGKDVSLEIHTRMTANDPKVLPPVSPSQAALVGSIVPVLSSLLRRVESELTAYNRKFDPEFHAVISHPQVWLSCESDDGVSWTFIVGRTDNPNFGYDMEFRGTDFVQFCAGY